ncbi:MAG TPA: hypothetical protein VII32_07545 [Thermoanaerobaculia bacterium]|jgi:hypothetical protein
MKDFLRHALATLAYRGGKVMRNAPEGFADFRAGEKTRTPVQIVAHLGDLLEWGMVLARGEKNWNEAKPQAWDAEVERFFDALHRFDDLLASNQPLGCSGERLFQGPIADALTHVGQLAMLRGLAGERVRAENYFGADVAVGRVGAEQTPPKREW